MPLVEQTVAVLRDGLPAAISDLALRGSVPLGLWRGEDYGAVLFVRRRSDAGSDCDVAIATRESSDVWSEPTTWSGGPWVSDPLRRPDKDSKPVQWLGASRFNNCVVVRGVASVLVSACDVKVGGEVWRVPVDSPHGAVLVGLEHGDSATIDAIDVKGQVIPAVTVAVRYPADGELELSFPYVDAP